MHEAEALCDNTGFVLTLLPFNLGVAVQVTPAVPLAVMLVNTTTPGTLLSSVKVKVLLLAVAHTLLAGPSVLFREMAHPAYGR